MKRRDTLTFEESREVVRNAKLKTVADWRKWKRPANIPSSPNVFYRDEWISWGDWLGTNTLATKHSKFLTFNEAREFVRNLGLKSQTEWSDARKSGKIPKNIPSNPHRTYKDCGWISYGDWVGTGNVGTKDREYLEFEAAKRFVQSLKLNTQIEWANYCKSGNKPDNVPACPQTVYNEEWISLRDWLGTTETICDQISGGRIARSSPNKLTLDQIEEKFKSFGYKLLETDYINNKTKLKCICPNGHHISTSYVELSRAIAESSSSRGCMKCFRELQESGNFNRVVTKDRLLKDIREIVLPMNQGRLPSYKHNQSADYGLDYDIHVAITRFGGYHKIRSELGLQALVRPNGYWHSWSNVETEIKTKFDLSAGVFPSYEMLESAKITISNVCKIHSISLAEMADRFGCKLASAFKCRDGHYVGSTYEAILDEYLYSRAIKHTVQPSVGRYRADFLIGSHYVEIWGFRRNDFGDKISTFYNNKRRRKERYYKKEGLRLIQIEGDSLFRDALLRIEEVEKELDSVFKSYGFNITKRRKFNAEIVAQTGFSWSDSTVCQQLELLIKSIGKFPEEKDIRRLGQDSLASAIHRLGGINRFRQMLGYPTKANKFTSLQHGANADKEILSALYKLCKQLGYCPKQKELAKLDVQLLGGITKHGGLEKFKGLLGIQRNRPRGYWNKDTVLKELLLYSKFPTLPQLRSSDVGLSVAVSRNGGLNYFRNLYNKQKGEQHEKRHGSN